MIYLSPILQISTKKYEQMYVPRPNEWMYLYDCILICEQTCSFQTNIVSSSLQKMWTSGFYVMFISNI